MPLLFVWIRHSMGRLKQTRYVIVESVQWQTVTQKSTAFHVTRSPRSVVPPCRLLRRRRRRRSRAPAGRRKSPGSREPAARNRASGSRAELCRRLSSPTWTGVSASRADAGARLLRLTRWRRLMMGDYYDEVRDKSPHLHFLQCQTYKRDNRGSVLRGRTDQ